jgi:hypothetical protein
VTRIAQILASGGARTSGSPFGGGGARCPVGDSAPDRARRPTALSRTDIVDGVPPPTLPGFAKDQTRLLRSLGVESGVSGHGGWLISGGCVFWDAGGEQQFEGQADLPYIGVMRPTGSPFPEYDRLLDML